MFKNKILFEPVNKRQYQNRIHMHMPITERIHNYFNNENPVLIRIWNGFQDSHKPYYYYCSYISELNKQSKQNTPETTPGGNNGIFNF
jgi:hypothetical protein